MITAVVGAGGKTTLIHNLAAEYRRAGRRVFVTTTTHMFIEPDTLLTDDPEPIIEQLERTGYAMAGLPQGPEKLCPLSEETYLTVCAAADEVLVEADGARHRAVKIPGHNEPVIPANAEKIIVVYGRHALGRTVKEAAFRREQVLQCLGVTEDTAITMEHVRTLLREGYLQPLREQFPNADIQVYEAPEPTWYKE